uniref:Endoplasmic reticulum transmembrane protein n=1 Tax=Romanomermis culicivorax TaxID=13658 RepID=A0A915IEJ0_ROMCU
MSIQWTVVALVLYVEVIFLILLMVPYIPQRIWKDIFERDLVQSICSYFNYASMGGAIVLVLFCLDAIRDINKYGYIDVPIPEQYQLHQADTTIHMRLFRAQRNFYISAFAIFLHLICRRMLDLVLTGESTFGVGATPSTSTVGNLRDIGAVNAENNETKAQLASMKDEQSKLQKEYDEYKKSHP